MCFIHFIVGIRHCI